MNQLFTLSEESVAHILQILQVAMMTGTDITDLILNVEFVAEAGRLNVSSNSQNDLASEINRLLAEIPREE